MTTTAEAHKRQPPMSNIGKDAAKYTPHEPKPDPPATVVDECRHPRCGARQVTIPASYANQVGGDHYKGFLIPPTFFINACKLPWQLGNAVKYVCRFVVKRDAQDLRKARHYITMFLDDLEANQ